MIKQIMGINRKYSWKRWMQMMSLSFIICHLSFSLCACSEKHDTVEEFADWQARNETYFEQQYQAHSASNIIKKWTVEDATEVPHTDCVLIDKLKEGSGTVTPYYSDTIRVHYSGRLLPSVSYPQGYVFDQSWSGTFDEATAVPLKFSMSEVILGFSTALQRMHKGDKWRIIIPYQLGYNAVEKTGVPAYSTLIYEVTLVDFWSKTKGDRDE